jgi:Rap1a immunity proteins
MRSLLAGFLGAALLVLPLEASALTGVELLRFCRQEKTTRGNLACVTYTRGFIDGFVSATIASNKNARACIPSDGVSADQGRLIIEKYLRDNPEKLDLEAGNLAMAAMIAAFRCP